MKTDLTVDRSYLCDYYVTCADIVKQNIAVITHDTSLMHHKSVSWKMTNHSQCHILSPSHW